MPKRTPTPRQRLEWRLADALDVHRVARFALAAATVDGHDDVLEAAQRVLAAARWDVTLASEALRRLTTGQDDEAPATTERRERKTTMDTERSSERQAQQVAS